MGEMFNSARHGSHRYVTDCLLKLRAQSINFDIQHSLTDSSALGGVARHRHKPEGSDR